MPYVQRDSSNAVCGLYAAVQPGLAEEWLGDTDPAVVIFRSPPLAVQAAQQRAKDFLADKDLSDFRALIASAISPTDLKAKIAALTAPQKANLIVAFILDYVASGRG